MGGMVEVGEGAYNSLEDKRLSTVKSPPSGRGGSPLTSSTRHPALAAPRL